MIADDFLLSAQFCVYSAQSHQTRCDMMRCLLPMKEISRSLSCAHQHFHSLHTFFKSNCSPASSVKCLSNYSAVVRHSNFSFCRLISRSFFSFPLFGYRIDDRQQKNDWTSARQTGRERARERKWKCEKLAWRKTKELSFVVEISRFLRGSNTELLVAKKKSRKTLELLLFLRNHFDYFQCSEIYEWYSTSNIELVVGESDISEID